MTRNKLRAGPHPVKHVARLADSETSLVPAAREQQRSTPNSGAGAGHSSRGKKRDATTYSGRRTEIVLRKNTATKKFVSIKDALVFLNVSYDTFARVHQVKRRLMF